MDHSECGISLDCERPLQEKRNQHYRTVIIYRKSVQLVLA